MTVAFVVYVLLFSVSLVFQFVDLYHRRFERASTWLVITAYLLIGVLNQLRFALVFLGGALREP